MKGHKKLISRLKKHLSSTNKQIRVSSNEYIEAKHLIERREALVKRIEHLRAE